MNIATTQNVAKQLAHLSLSGHISFLSGASSIVGSHQKQILTSSMLKSESENKQTSVKPVLRLLTKQNCSLCEEAKHVLLSAPNNYCDRLVLTEVDILQEGNEELFDLYRFEIPVFFLGPKFISKNYIDLEKLEQELKIASTTTSTDTKPN